MKKEIFKFKRDELAYEPKKWSGLWKHLLDLLRRSPGNCTTISLTHTDGRIIHELIVWNRELSPEETNEVILRRDVRKIVQ